MTAPATRQESIHIYADFERTRRDARQLRANACAAVARARAILDRTRELRKRLDALRLKEPGPSWT